MYRMSKHDIFRKQIYRFASKMGKYGITTDEVAAAFNTVPNCVSGRMTELKYAGWLIPADKIRLTRRGKPAFVYLANPQFKWLLRSWALEDKKNGESTDKKSAA